MQVAEKVEEKYCTKCETTKAISEFGLWMSKKGVAPAPLCKGCVKDKNQAYHRATYKKKTKIDHSKLTEKKCSKCGTTKPIEDFNKLRKDGIKRASWCKVCKSAGSESTLLRGNIVVKDKENKEVRVKCKKCKEEFTRTPLNFAFCVDCHDENKRINAGSMSKFDGHYLDTDECREITTKAIAVNTRLRHSILKQCKTIDPKQHMREFGITKSKPRVSTVDALEINNKEMIDGENYDD